MKFPGAWSEKSHGCLHFLTTFVAVLFNFLFVLRSKSFLYISHMWSPVLYVLGLYSDFIAGSQTCQHVKKSPPRNSESHGTTSKNENRLSVESKDADRQYEGDWRA